MLLSIFQEYQNLPRFMILSIFYMAFYCNFSMKNIKWRLHVRYSLPDDEHMMFETCRRHQELNRNINLKSAFRWLTLNKRVSKSGRGSEYAVSVRTETGLSAKQLTKSVEGSWMQYIVALVQYHTSQMTGQSSSLAARHSSCHPELERTSIWSCATWQVFMLVLCWVLSDLGFRRAHDKKKLHLSIHG
jgi:hypothetical protein